MFFKMQFFVPLQVDQWWLDKAYLENRWALVPFCSMSGVSDMGRIWSFKPGCMVKVGT